MNAVANFPSLLRFGLCLALCASWLVVCPARAEEVVPALVRVPVFFITDRNLQSDTPERGAKFGPHRKYVGDCHHDPYMGAGYCVVKNTAGKPLSKTLVSLGWAAADLKEKEGTLRVRPISGSNFSEIQTELYAKVRSAALKSQRQDIVLFAHGYKNTFESAGRTAARFSYQYENPVVLYSWPSVAKMRSYSSDENNNEWSQEHFNDVLTNLEGTCTSSPPLKLRVLAHSMGSRLVVRATPLLREKAFVSEVSLVCPDVDQGLVKHYARRYLSVKGTAQIRLYMSQRDKALALSQILHGGYCRLGECADAIASLVVSDTNANTNTPSAQPIDANSEMQKLVEQTKKRMQTIDFTALDRGVIGHKIPVELMYAMSYTSGPGPGLKLVSETSGQRSRASRVLSSLTRLRYDSTGSSEACLRVQRTSTDRTDLQQVGTAAGSALK